LQEGKMPRRAQRNLRHLRVARVAGAQNTKFIKTADEDSKAK
jgi:hypothetical protein